MRYAKMSKTQSINTKLKSEVKRFFRAHTDEVLDIILFGSVAIGKEKPNDIDLLLLFKDKKDIDTSYELKKILRKAVREVSITDKTYKDLLSGTFKAAEAIISDGYSLVHDKQISQELEYLNLHLFKYDLTALNKSERMRFYYSLYGRTKEQKGMVKELNAIKFSDAVLLCPIDKVEQMKEYLTGWNINFIEFPMLIPNRLRSIL